MDRRKLGKEDENNGVGKLFNEPIVQELVNGFKMMNRSLEVI